MQEQRIEARWVTEKEVARITSKALSTLRNDRHLGRGIPYHKDSKCVRYFLPDVFDYMFTRKIETT